jgi:hypothetical protein
MATLTTSYKKIATGGSKTFGYATGYLELWAKYNSQDIVNNKTNYSVELRLVVTGGYIGNYQSTPYSLSATGITTGSGDSGSGDYTSRTIKTITGNVTHSSDGKKSVSMSGNINFTAWGQTLSVSGSADLPTIPRTSGVACSSPYIGDTATITIDRKNANFTDTISYSIGNLTGTIAEKTTETVLSLDTSSIENEIYALIPNDKSIEGTINCITYSGDTQIGTSSCKFNLYTNEDKCKPEVNGTVVDTNAATIAITGDSSKLIKHVSKPKVTVQATAKNSSTISSYSINLNDGQTSDLQEATFESIGSDSITVNATDSRGYSGSKDLTLEMIDYVKLHIDSIDISRPEDVSNEVILNANGVWFNGNFNDAVTNTLSARFQYKSSNDASWTNGGTLTPTINGNTFTFTNISLGNIYDYNNEYQFKIILTDKLMSVGSENKEAVTVPKGQEVIAIGEDSVWVYGDLLLNDENVNTKYLKYKNHVKTVEDLPSNGQSSGTPIEPMLSNFSACLNVATNSDSNKVFSNYGKTHAKYYVVLGAFGSSWPARYRPMVVYTDYKEQLKLSIIKYGNYYYACILAEYDANKPVYYAYNGTSANNAITSDLAQNTHRVTSNLVLCSLMNSTYREFSSWPSYPSLERTNIPDLKFDTEYHSDYTQVFTNVSYYTEANIVKSVYDTSQGSFYWNDGMILIQPDADDRPQIITTIVNPAGEVNDVYTVGDNNDIYRYNSNQEWEQWAKNSGGSGGGDNYSSTEQVIGTWIDGKPIYRKVINFGKLPNNAIGYVQTGFKQGEIFITNASGVTTNGTTQYFLPYVHPTTLAKCVSLYAETTSGNIVVTIRTGEDRSGHTAHIILEYTKTTD